MTLLQQTSFKEQFNFWCNPRLRNKVKASPNAVMLAGVTLRLQKHEGAAVMMCQLLEKTTFAPEEVREVSAAYEKALRKLGLVERNDPVTELIASKMIGLAQRGVRERKRLIQITLKEFGIE